MNDLTDFLLPVMELRRPKADHLPAHIAGFECPKGVAALLNVANGFTTKRRVFRVLGTEHDVFLPSIDSWNAAEWKRAYGACASDILFFSDDIFGDQYGYRFGVKREFVKFYCEGGEVEVIDGGINWFINALADPFGAGALDEELVSAFESTGRWPNPNEHIAFKLPLVVGGKRDVANLAVEPEALHLGTLAQLSQKNRQFPEGTIIKKFSAPPNDS